MKTLIGIATLLSILGCGGGAGPGGTTTQTTCTRANGPYVVTCDSLSCSDGSGSCAANAPTVLVDLTGTGVQLAAATWTKTSDQWSSDDCNEAITESDPSGDTANLELLCNLGGTVCTEDETLTFGAGGECTTVLTWTRN